MRASDSEMKPRFSPMQSAASPKPVAAILATRPLSVDAAHVAPVFYQPGLRIGLLPEVADRESFQFIEKLIVVRRKESFHRRWRGARVLLWNW